MFSRFNGGPIGEWEAPWLIQRLQRPFKASDDSPLKDNPFSFGGGLRNGGLSKEAMNLLREIFTFDYMGSAEFEFGSVPMALRSMIASIPDLVTKNFQIDQNEVAFEKWEERYFKKPVKGVMKTIYVLAKGSHQEPMEKFIRSLVGPKEPRLKEHPNLKNAILDPSDPKDDWRQKTQGWLDINNCLMFFTDKEMFEKTSAMFIDTSKEAVKAP